MSLFTELKRRNVFRVGAAYVVATWLVVEVSSVLLDIYSAPEWVLKVLVALLVVLFPLVLLISWVYELTPGGIKKESEVERSTSVAQETGRQLDLVTIGLLIGSLEFVGYDHFLADRNAPVKPIPVVAQADESVLQDQIARQIVSVLPDRLGVTLNAGKQHTAATLPDATAHDLYLQGNFAKQRRTVESMLGAIDLYQQGVKLDPGLAPAWGGLARAATLAGEFLPSRFEAYGANVADAVA